MASFFIRAILIIAALSASAWVLFPTRSNQFTNECTTSRHALQSSGAEHAHHARSVADLSAPASSAHADDTPVDLGPAKLRIRPLPAPIAIDERPEPTLLLDTGRIPPTPYRAGKRARPPPAA